MSWVVVFCVLFYCRKIFSARAWLMFAAPGVPRSLWLADVCERIGFALYYKQCLLFATRLAYPIIIIITYVWFAKYVQLKQKFTRRSQMKRSFLTWKLPSRFFRTFAILFAADNLFLISCSSQLHVRLTYLSSASSKRTFFEAYLTL